MYYKFSSTIRCLILVLCFLTAVKGGGTRPIYDFDGDGRTDFTVERFNGPNTQLQWFILQSRDGFAARNWGYQFVLGQGGDQPGWGDYDGDGKWDVTVVRREPSTPYLFWYIQNSSNGSMTAQHWGLRTDTQVPQDYDGDGKTDFAVFRSGWWYILRSSDGRFHAEQFGSTSALPFMGGDYDGDGKDDLAVLQNGFWIRYSATGWWIQYAVGNREITGVVSGDYDGDGKADVAIRQGNLWLWERSSDGQLGGGLRFGFSTNDIPVPADYDGDGKTDIAVFRGGGQNYFYVQQSRDGFLAMPWGGGGIDANIFDHRYIPPTGFRPSGLARDEFKDNGPCPRRVEIWKN